MQHLRIWSFLFPDLCELAGERGRRAIFEYRLLVTVRKDALVRFQLVRLNHLAVSRVVSAIFPVLKLLIESLGHLSSVGRRTIIGGAIIIVFSRLQKRLRLDFWRSSALILELLHLFELTRTSISFSCLIYSLEPPVKRHRVALRWWLLVESVD